MGRQQSFHTWGAGRGSVTHARLVWFCIEVVGPAGWAILSLLACLFRSAVSSAFRLAQFLQCMAPIYCLARILARSRGRHGRHHCCCFCASALSGWPVVFCARVPCLLRRLEPVCARRNGFCLHVLSFALLFGSAPSYHLYLLGFFVDFCSRSSHPYPVVKSRIVF